MIDRAVEAPRLNGHESLSISPQTRLAWALIASSALAVFFGNLRFGRAVLGAGLEDDFFYYAQVGKNLAFHHTSTFDGIHLTNGYHPLWLLLITGLIKVFGVGGILHCTTDLPFAFALECVQFALVMATAVLVFRSSRLFCSPALSLCIVMLEASFDLILVRSGMEVGLTVALVFGLLWYRLRPEFRWSAKTAFMYGSLASLAVLSRLDTVLLVALVFLFDVLPSHRENPERWGRIVLFFLGLWPVVAYVIVNQTFFQSLTPISGTAKQLRFHHTPSLAALGTFLNYFRRKVSPLLGPCVLLTVAGLVQLLRRWNHAPDLWAKRFFLGVLLFAPIQLFTITILSDWQLWLWYLYPWLIGGVVGTWVVAPKLQTESKRGVWALTAVAAVLLVAQAAGAIVSSSPFRNPMFLAANDDRAFAAEHHGIYAMGDRAGLVGYTLGEPMIQLEGLMMDKPYLENIRLQRNLIDVLHQYDVRYYITTNDEMDASGCFIEREPFQAGADSAAMLGKLCQLPVATYRHGKFVTHIFDLAAPSNGLVQGEK